MKSLLVIFVTLFAAIQAAEILKLTHPKWVAFKAKYNKDYKNDEMEHKGMKFFFKNKEIIEQHNLQFDRGLVSYRMDLNEYSDIDHSEFVKTMSGFEGASNSSRTPLKKLHGASFIGDPNFVIPDFVDWRKLGAVTAVKNQGLCNSCWAFATTGVLESQHFIRNGKLVPLSAQCLIDCTRGDNNGCIGGRADRSLIWAMLLHDIVTESSYPYEGIEGKCRYNPANAGAKVVDVVYISEGDENELKAAVATMGPVAIGIDNSHIGFNHYSQGIYYEPKCSSRRLYHAVLVVGYGTENGSDYWLVKNSWGTTWGENGYVKMARNKNNNCGVASLASYPIVAGPNKNKHYDAPTTARPLISSDQKPKKSEEPKIPKKPKEPIIPKKPKEPIIPKISKKLEETNKKIHIVMRIQKRNKNN